MSRYDEDDEDENNGWFWLLMLILLFGGCSDSTPPKSAQVGAEVGISIQSKPLAEKPLEKGTK